MAAVIRVLHVDDESDFGALTAELLESADERLDVETASSAGEGLDCLEEEAYDCIVSDYDMPGQTGIDFLEDVRVEYPDLPFILFTGKGSEEIASEAISAGVSDYLQKEAGMDQYTLLANRISNLVRQSRAEATVEAYSSELELAAQYRDRLLAIISDESRSETDQINALLELGCECFGVESGNLVMIDDMIGHHEIVHVTESAVDYDRVSDLSETYCRKTMESDTLLDIHHAAEQGWENDPAYHRYNFESYIGGKLRADNRLYGTLCFVDKEAREPFTVNEKSFFDLLRQWFSHLLERRRRFERTETIFEVTQDALFILEVTPARSFEIRRVNRTYESVTGESTADLRGEPASRILATDGDTEFTEYCRDCLDAGESIEFEYTGPINGAQTTVQCRLAPIFDAEKIVQIVGSVRV